jgi:hypothetical protein
MAIPQKYGPFYEALPGNQGAPTRRGQLTELDRLIELCKEVKKNPQSPTVWSFGVFPDGPNETCAPVFLRTEFRARVEGVLADIGTNGAGVALRRFRRINFWQSKDGFRIEESRAPEPTAETRRKYAWLVGKVGIDLAKVRDREFLGMEPSVTEPRGSAKPAKVPRRKKVSGRDRDRAQTPQCSPTDVQRYKRIGQEQIATHTNPELWTRWRTTETQQKRKINYQGFRHSLNRIRIYYKLPFSADLRKKVTSVGHSQSDPK